MKRFTLLLILISLASSSMAKMYKWVDADGKTQYSDRPPIIQPKSGVAKMNAEGMITQKAESTEEKKARIEQENAEKAKEKEKYALRQHDRLLLETYSSVQQIEQHRDRRINNLNSSINTLTVSKKDIQSQLSQLQQNTKIFTRQKRAIPKNLSNDIASKQNQIQELEQQISITQQDIAHFRDTSNQDIQRYKELTSNKQP